MVFNVWNAGNVMSVASHDWMGRRGSVVFWRSRLQWFSRSHSSLWLGNCSNNFRISCLYPYFLSYCVHHIQASFLVLSYYYFIQREISILNTEKFKETLVWLQTLQDLIAQTQVLHDVPLIIIESDDLAYERIFLINCLG